MSTKYLPIRFTRKADQISASGFYYSKTKPLPEDVVYIKNQITKTYTSAVAPSDVNPTLCNSEGDAVFATEVVFNMFGNVFHEAMEVEAAMWDTFRDILCDTFLPGRGPRSRFASVSKEDTMMFHSLVHSPLRELFITPSAVRVLAQDFRDAKSILEVDIALSHRFREASDHDVYERLYSKMREMTFETASRGGMIVMKLD